jgi:hypothetical protein
MHLAPIHAYRALAEKWIIRWHGFHLHNRRTLTVISIQSIERL